MIKATEREEIDRIKSHLGSVHWGFKIRTTRKIAQKILLDDWFTYNGKAGMPIDRGIGVIAQDLHRMFLPSFHAGHN